MILYILRGAFLLLATSVTMLYVLNYQVEGGSTFPQILLMIGMTLGVSLTVITFDIFLRKKKMSALSGVFLGLLGGLLVAYALSFPVDLIGKIMEPDTPYERRALFNLLEGVKVFIGLVSCYIGISLVMQTKDDFRFVIPYVEFAKQVRGIKPVLLDSSVVIDGRIADIVNTNIIQGMLIVPKFVLSELQLIADSSDRLRRNRGRRGLETLQKLQENPTVEISIDETEVDGPTVDQKLISLAQHLQAQVMTNDFNLNKIATLRGVEVINLNDLAKFLRPVALPGERMHVKVVKPGESSSQGVGYLEDGTMVVVENARRMLHRDIDITVTSTFQTSAGRMIFGRYDGDNDHDYDQDNGDGTSGSGSGASSTTGAGSRGGDEDRDPHPGSYDDSGHGDSSIRNRDHSAVDDSTAAASKADDSDARPKDPDDSDSANRSQTGAATGGMTGSGARNRRNPRRR